MLNPRLQTQPLDPAVLQKLGIDGPAAAKSTVQATQPLQAPELLLDNWRPEPLPASQPQLPAQSSSVSQALGTRLNPQEAELLLGVSARLADVRQQDPAQFQLVMGALQNLNAGQNGQVDFSALDPTQKQVLSGLGMTPQNTQVIFQQLYHMLLPGEQTQGTQAFQKIQSSVTSFISNLDLRQQTVQSLQQQARDLTAVQGVVTSLSAKSIGALLTDQTAGVYDTGISKINSQNFNIQSGMDYTLGHFVVLSQNSPQTLQQVEGLIQKVKQEQPLKPQERRLLNQMGLNLNAHNKLESLIDGQSLDFDSVNQLENVIYSMKDPSPAYQQVLHASAAVIHQSGKLQELSQLARKQVGQVQATTQQVQVQSQQVQQLRTDTNYLDSQLKFAHHKVENLSTTITAATGLLQNVTVDTSLLQAWNIHIVDAPQGKRFFVNDKEVSRLEAVQHMGQILRQQQSEITRMADELARKKTEALKASANLNQATQTLEVQVETLEKTEQEIVKETTKLRELEADFQQTLVTTADQLSAEEKAVVGNSLAPAVTLHVETAVQSAEAVRVEIQSTVTVAREAIVQAQSIQRELAEDLDKWDQTLADSGRILQELGTQIKQVEGQLAAAGAEAPETVLEPKARSERQTLAPADSGGLLFDETLATDSQQQLKRQQQAKAQEQIEASFLERSQQSKRLAETREQQKRQDTFNQAARQQLKTDVEALRGDSD